MKAGWRWFEIIYKSAGFLLLAAAFLFAGMEIAARYRFKKEDARFFNGLSNEKFHHPRPFVMAAGRPGGDHNALGYPSELPVLPKPAAEFRIFVIGGSTVYENGEFALPPVLQKIFEREGHKNARVYNYGAVSSISRQDVARVWIDIAGYQPDLVVEYGGGNDLPQSADPRINYPHRYVLQEVDPMLNFESPDYDLLSALAVNSVWVRKFHPHWLEERIAGDYYRALWKRLPPSEVHMRLRAESYAQNMRWGAYFSRAAGANFAVVLQPVLSYKKHETPEELKITSPESIAEENLARGFFLEELGKYKNEFDTYDLTRIFEDYPETIYRDKIHIDVEKYNPILAEAIYKKIVPYLNRKKPRAELPGLLPETRFIY